MYWCQALHITNTDRYQNNERPRALTLLNLPQLKVKLKMRLYGVHMANIPGVTFVVCCVVGVDVVCVIGGGVVVQSTIEDEYRLMGCL